MIAGRSVALVKLKIIRAEMISEVARNEETALYFILKRPCRSVVRLVRQLISASACGAYNVKMILGFDMIWEAQFLV